MATEDDIYRAIRAADAAGDGEAVRKLGGYLQQMRGGKTDALLREADGMNPAKGGDNFLAGAGKAFSDTWSGLQQADARLRSMLPGTLPDTARAYGGAADAIERETDERKRLDAPLMRTGAGRAGNITGHIATALPAMFVPGANTLAGAGLTGALIGGAQPVGSDDSRMTNAAIGGAGGIGGTLLGRGVAAGWQGGRALLEPLTAGGREKIAGRTLAEFGVGAKDVAGLSGAPTITGARPTLAELVRDPQAAAGASRLQDALRTADPRVGNQLLAREMENNAARVGTLRDLAGVDGARDFALANRAGTSGPIYDDAFRATSAITPSQMKAQERLIRNGTLDKLMASPAIAEAQRMAQANALNAGKRMSPEGSIEGLHNMKMALDDMMREPATAAQRVKVDSLKAAQKRLIDVIETLSPDYRTARMVHADMSRPINQMDVAQGLLRAGTSATEDLAGNPRLMPQGLLGAIRDDAAQGALVKKSTGRPLGLLADVLEPDQLAKVRGVTDEVGRAAAVGRAANGPGSATAQRMASGNVLRQLLGPLGMPQSWAESAVLQPFARGASNTIYSGAEPKIQQALADLVMDPSKAAAALKAAGVKPAQIPAAMRDLLAYVEQAGRTSVPAALVSGER